MINEQDWKEQLEFSNSQGRDRDENAYREVFEALSREPDFTLSPRFADQVILRINKQQKKAGSRDMLYLILGSLLMLMAAVIGAWLAGFKPDFGVFKFLSGYAGLVTFGVAFILFIHWLDKKVLSKKIVGMN